MQTISILKKEKVKPVSIVADEHLIGDNNGSSMMVFGSIHGN